MKLINSVHCDSDDDVIKNDSTNNNDNKDDKRHQFSISKQLVIKILSDSLLVIVKGWPNSWGWMVGYGEG